MNIKEELHRIIVSRVESADINDPDWWRKILSEIPKCDNRTILVHDTPDYHTTQEITDECYRESIIDLLEDRKDYW